MKKIIYLDNNATTQMDDEVIKALKETENIYGNPSSLHSVGRKAKKYLNTGRKNVANLLNCSEDEIIFNSGATEANNTVLHIAKQLIEEGKGKRILTTSIEHPAIVETVKYLKKEGIKVDLIKSDSEGRVKEAEYKELLGSDVVLVSIMTANNETGTIQEIQKFCELAHEAGALFHTDATQAIGKIEIDVKKSKVDYLSLSGHKFYGPKGVGALYVKTGCPKKTFIHGGHQEGGFRAGTYNTPAIYAMGIAAKLAKENLVEENKKLWEMRETLRKGLLETIDDIKINGCQEHCLPGTLNVSFKRVEGESMLLMLDFKGVEISTGSACAASSLKPSYVLLESGVPIEMAHGSLRFSFGRFNTMNDVNYVLEVLPPIIKRLREISTI